MTDLFHRLNPFRPPSPTKPRSSSPLKKRKKSPHLHLTLDRPDSATGYQPSRPSSSLESPIPDIPYGRYLFDTQRSLDLNRPVFTPLPPSNSPEPDSTTPGRRAKTPSILRTLAHHPSLSALKSKQKLKKEVQEDKEERLSGSIDEEVPDDEDRRGWMGTWGSAKKRRGRKGSLKLVKSMPSVRSSESDYRPSIDAPVPALPEVYTKRGSKGLDFSKARKPDIEISLEGYEEPVSPTRPAKASSSPSRILMTRSRSIDLSPRRQTPLPRHLSTPPKGSGHIASPPRLSLPSTTQHPHPVPRDWVRRTSLEIIEYNPELYGDRPQDGSESLRTPELLPTSPSGERCIISAKEQNSIHVRDTYTRLTDSPSSTLTLPVISTTRSESPFEVKLSPMVTRRMSLEAFGPSVPSEQNRESMQSLAESIEEMEDEYDQGTPIKILENTLEGWHGTQLTTIDESPSSLRNTQSTPSATTSNVETGRTVYFTPDSRSTGSYSPVPALSAKLAEAHAQHTRALDAQVRESQAVIEELEKEVETLKKELEAESSENDAAWKVVDEMQGDLKRVESSAEERHQALEQMRQAMMENEDYFDTLQDAHDQLAERCGRMEMALSNNAEMRDSQEEQIATMTRINKELRATVQSLEQDKSNLESQLQQSHDLVESKTSELVEAARLTDITAEENSAQVDSYERRIAEMATRVVELDTLRALLSLRESELETRQEECKELREEVKAWERRLADKDMLVQQLKDKVGTKQYEIDETRIQAESEIKDLQGKLADVERVSMDLVQQLSTPSQLETTNTQLEEEIQELQFLLDEAQSQLESARSDLEARDGDVSLQQGEVEQLRAELEASNESISRLTAQSSRAQREHDRVTSDLQWQIEDLRAQLADQATKVVSAFVEREISSATTADVQSRLKAYLDEIDRLKVAEARLASEVSDLRTASSSETLRVVELEKRIKELKEDRILMDISLDNKETEITLLQRQASRSGSVTPTRKRLVASTSRIPSTPTLARPGETPGAGRRLSVSTSIKRPTSAAGIAKATRRESIVTPNPTISTRSITTPTPSSRVLGSSTKHNRIDTKLTGPRKTAIVPESSGQLKKQTSMQSLRSSSASGHRLDGMVEVDEREGN